MRTTVFIIHYIVHHDFLPISFVMNKVNHNQHSYSIVSVSLSRIHFCATFCCDFTLKGVSGFSFLFNANLLNTAGDKYTQHDNIVRDVYYAL